MVLKETTISPISMKHLVIRIRMTLLTRQDIRLQSPKYWGTKILLGKQMEISMPVLTLKCSKPF